MAHHLIFLQPTSSYTTVRTTDTFLIKVICADVQRDFRGFEIEDEDIIPRTTNRYSSSVLLEVKVLEYAEYVVLLCKKYKLLLSAQHAASFYLITILLSIRILTHQVIISPLSLSGYIHLFLVYPPPVPKREWVSQASYPLRDDEKKSW